MSFTTWLASLRNSWTPNSKFLLRHRPNRARRGWTRPTNVEALEQRVVLSAFTVINTADSGTGSLRQAILDANANPGPDVIDFNIPGTGAHTIAPLTPLPILEYVTIDARTESDYAANGLHPIELSGENIPSNYGLILGDGGVVQGMTINRFATGVAIGVTGRDVHIESNYIGSDTLGMSVPGVVRTDTLFGIPMTISNQEGIRVGGASRHAVIGGVTAESRNIISGNFIGIRIVDLAPEAQIIGNYIGTNAAGNAALPNNTGISDGNSESTIVGGFTPAERNIISGNGTGVDGASRVVGNYIGTDATGMSAIANVYGVLGGTLVGGTEPGARNLISGNSYFGVSAARVQGNWIGLDATGNGAIGNASGVGASNGHVIGGTTPEARNVISGNGNGIYTTASGVTIQGNYIGTNAEGTSGVGNQTGIGLYYGSGNLIGGTVPGAGNVISGNGVGIYDFATSGENHIEGNLIGTASDGSSALGNWGVGIDLAGGSRNQIIGGALSGAGNTIAYNGTGIRSMQYGGVATQNLFQGNSIYANANLGIDLSGGPHSDGVTANDLLDADTGSNELQNYPVLTAASSAATTRVEGSLHSTPNSTFAVDFYANSAVDLSGYGEGERWLGAITVTTDASGNANFDAVLLAASSAGEFITSTATDALGNTSEFSAGVVSINAVLPVTVEVTGGTFTYDGLPHGATSSSVTAADGFSAVPTLTYYVGTDLSGPGSSDAPVDAGTYTVVASFVGDDGHYPGSASTLITIDKADVTVSVTGGTFTYDGSAHGATSNSVTGPGGLNTTAELAYYSGETLLSGAPTNARTYTVVANYAGDANHNAGSASDILTILAKDLTATGSTQSSINISKAGTLTFTLSNVSGIIVGDDTVSDLFNGATFQLSVNGTLYSVTSTATVLTDGTIEISWRMSQELYQDLYAALGSATPSNKTLVDFSVSGTSNNGNYTITEDVFSRIFQQGKVLFP